MTPAVLDIDPFSREFLAAPHAFHPALRDAGSVVWLSKYQIWGVARHAEVSSALQNREVFCSGRGVGLSDFAKEPPWRPPSIILEADPPLHTRTRSVLAKVLSRPALQSLRERMEQQAEQLLDAVLRERSFDAVPALSQAFPLRVFPDAVGVIREGRENLLPYGDMAFNAFGPRNEIFERAMKRAGEVSGWIVAQCRRSALDAHGFGAQVYAEADAGVISEEEAAMLVRSLLTAGLDTTIQGIAHALAAFADFPDQWKVLREKPSLTRNAFEEAIRFASPVMTFFRTTTREVELGGIPLSEGHKVLLFLASANRDPRRWANPDNFEVERESAGHVGFGLGIHQCVGQMVARLEAEVMIQALLRRVESIEPAGAPQYRLNNTLRTLESLPLRVQLARRPAAAGARGGRLSLRVSGRVQEALDVCSLELSDPSGADLPPFQAGAHLDVYLPSGISRQYSICSDPGERGHYRIAVLRESASRGGSSQVHESVHAGTELQVSLPRNHFTLVADAKRSVLLAGGIGVTPLLSMAYALSARGQDFALHYCAKSRDRAAFAAALLHEPFSSRVQLHFSQDHGQRLDMALVLAAETGAHVYVCGPRSFISSAQEAATQLGWPESHLHWEMFAADVVHLESDRAFQVELARSGKTIQVGKDQTITEAIRAAGVHIPVSCEQGVCGTCLTPVLSGTPDHRDKFLTAQERAQNDQFTPCCSRSKTPKLVLDI